MSGLIGLIHLDGRPVETDKLALPLRTLSRYGRDSRNLLIDKNAGFGYVHSNTYPDSANGRNQPYREGKFIGLFDGRVDYRDDLLNVLHYEPAKGRSISDVALIVALYRKYGEKCLYHLVGDFAFAIWDTERQTLFCARDHVGVRPLYYYRNERLVAFSTDVESLISFDDVPVEIDEDEVARYLRHPRIIRQKRTFYRDIDRLPHAHWMEVGPRSFRETSYWDPDAVPTRTYRSEAEYVEQLREVLGQAVSARLRTNQAVGTHLSGGLDSSALTVMVARQLQDRGGNLKSAYTWSPDFSESYPRMNRDERLRIEQVCLQQNIHCHYPRINAEDLRAFMDRDVSLWSTVRLNEEWIVARDAERQGVRILISGWGGDEGITFNGRGYLPELLTRGQWPELVRQLYRQARGGAGRMVSALPGTFVLPFLSRGMWLRLAERFERSYPPSLASEQLVHRSMELDDVLSNEIQDRASIRAFQIALFRHGHLAHRMEAWARLGAEYGISYTFPLTDRRVLEFAYALPSHLYVRGGFTRYLFRKAVEPILPAEITWERSKHDMASEIRRRRNRLETWRKLAGELVSSDRWNTPYDWIDMPRLKSEITDIPDRVDGRHGFRFLRIMTTLEMMALQEHRTMAHAII